MDIRFYWYVIAGYSDYYLINSYTKEKLDVEMQKLVSLTKDYLISAEEKSSDLPRLASDLESQFKLVEFVHEEYKIKNKSCNLYGMLIVGIAVL